MHEFLKRARPGEVDRSTRAMLEEIHERYKECQHLAPKPYVVQVAIPHADAVFNSEVIIDVMYIQGHPVLHCADRATNFQAARFLTKVSTECNWQTFMQMWVLVYLGAPDNQRHYQGSSFVSPRLQEMSAEFGISCRPVGFEAENAMSVVERYHKPLRDTYLKLQETYKMVPLNTPATTAKPTQKRRSTKVPESSPLNGKMTRTLEKSLPTTSIYLQ